MGRSLTIVALTAWSTPDAPDADCDNDGDDDDGGVVWCEESAAVLLLLLLCGVSASVWHSSLALAGDRDRLGAVTGHRAIDTASETGTRTAPETGVDADVDSDSSAPLVSCVVCVVCVSCVACAAPSVPSAVPSCAHASRTARRGASLCTVSHGIDSDTDIATCQFIFERSVSNFFFHFFKYWERNKRQ